MKNLQSLIPKWLDFPLILLVVLALPCWLVISGVPTKKEIAKAKVLETRTEEIVMALSLELEASKVGGLTNIPNEFILNPLREAHEHSKYPKRRDPFADHTNALGKVIDVWQMPFEIKFIGQTNFVIISGGPNQKFGDADDIIFSRRNDLRTRSGDFYSFSNDFVKP